MKVETPSDRAEFFRGGNGARASTRDEGDPLFDDEKSLYPVKKVLLGRRKTGEKIFSSKCGLNLDIFTS